MNLRIRKLKGMFLNNMHHKYRLEKLDKTIIDEQTENLPLNIRKALALKITVEKMPIFIQEDELIVGGRTIYNLPKYHTEKEIEDSAFSNNKLYDEIFNSVYNDSIDEIGDHVSDTNPPNYEKIIERGLQWYWDFADSRLSSNDLNKDQRNFYKASKIVITGIKNYMQRFMDLIDSEISADALTEERKVELIKIKNNIKYISKNPPKTFFQAVQLIYFIHTMIWVEAVCLVTLCKIDSIIYKFYENDIKSKQLTKDEALEIIECFILKLNQEVDKPNRVYDTWFKGDTGQSITIGAKENDITFLILRAVKDLKLVNPFIHIRLNENTSTELWGEIVDVLSFGCGNNMVLYWDENVKKALKNVGIYEKNDIDNYCGAGCWEIIIDGKSSHRQCGSVDLLRPLEWLLNNGKNFLETSNSQNIIDSKFVGVNMGNLDKYLTFEEFKDAYKTELRYYILIVVSNIIKTRLAYNPLISTFMDDCIDNGRDLKNGGARYRETDLQASSLANIADSLLTIKNLVYDNKEFTINELKKIVLSNYEGYEDLRQRIINKLPKYGNDINEVDSIAKEIIEFFADEVTRYTNGWGDPFRARIAGVDSYVVNKNLLGASLDGRKIGDYTSHNSSPQLGFDKKGPTAVIKSITKIDTSKFAGGFILDLKFSKSIFRAIDNRKKLEKLIETHFKLGGCQLQFNIIDSYVLKDAMKHPEKYKDLIVRVWGFSAYFVELPREFQEHIIKRSELF